MEPNTDGKPGAQPTGPSSAPFMDVAPPRPAAAAPATPTPPEPSKPTETPAETNGAPKDPPADQADEPEQLINEEAAKPTAQKPVKSPKNPSNGVGMIILVTFLVMVILAGLAIYAYSKSK